jgi:restriction system protein
VVVDRIARIPEGHLIDVVMTPWLALYREINRDPGFMYRLTSLQLEELIAGAYKLAGFPSVTITPRSGDHGRDVIATSRDGYTVRVLDQAKKYAPDRTVGYEAIRAFIMVLDADRATRGYLTTTGVFPPNVLRDPFIAPRLGSTLELVDGANLTRRLAELAHGAGVRCDTDGLPRVISKLPART